jgi:urea carboxylase
LGCRAAPYVGAPPPNPPIFNILPFMASPEHETFSLSKYNEFLASISSEAATFKSTQQAAFEAERDRWAVDNLLIPEEIAESIPEPTDIELPPNSELVISHIPANVWQIVVEVGTEVEVGDRLIVLESMKMEMTIVAHIAGTVIEIFCTEGQMVAVEQGLCIIQASKN